MIELLKKIAVKVATFLHCGVDKIYHFIVLLILVPANIIVIEFLPTIWAAAIVGVEIAVTKEYADSKCKGYKFSWGDIIAGILAIVMVVVGYFLII